MPQLYKKILDNCKGIVHYFVSFWKRLFSLSRINKDYFDKWGEKLYTEGDKKRLYYQTTGRMDGFQTKITNSYKKISNFVFHYLIFLITVVVAVVIFQRIIAHSNTTNIFQSNDTMLVQKTKLIAGFNKFLKQNIKDNDLQIQILQGDFENEQGFITSVNNLITYKGFVIPRYFYMYSTIPFKHLSYFSGGAYDISELENFVDTFVFTKKITVVKPFARVQLPLYSTLEGDFNLSCIFEHKITPRTCNYFLNDFLDSFFVYILSSDYSGLSKIFEAIDDTTTHKTRFCEGLSKYLLYADDQSDNIKELFSRCGPSYEVLFKRTILFMEIQQTLENQTFEKTSYKDKLLNGYKLLSYQQQIYQDFLINKADTYKINTYLDFVKEVLQKDNIDPFYIDEIYRYNNKYLAVSLGKIAYQSNIFTQNLGSSKIASLLTTINTLNEGEPMLGFLGLIARVHNPSLITQKYVDTGTNTPISQSERIQTKLQNISYLTIDTENISDTTIDLIAYLKFFSPDQNETVKAHIIMEYTDDVLWVKSIDLQNKPELNDVIKNLLRIQNFSIGELYSYISKNLLFYEQTSSPVNTSTDLCPAVQNIKEITLISCTTTGVRLNKNTVSYAFTFKNGGLDTVTISDKTLETLVKTSYATIIGNAYSLIDIITSIVSYTAPAQQVHEGTTNAIVVFEKIQQYLGIKANDIADKSGTILVDISLGGINFIVKYTLATNALGPWYFKDVFANDRPYLIQNLNLVLDDSHQNNINSFVIDPLAAIKNADLAARQSYDAFNK